MIELKREEVNKCVIRVYVQTVKTRRCVNGKKRVDIRRVNYSIQ
jgi:hypothetical protein